MIINAKRFQSEEHSLLDIPHLNIYSDIYEFIEVQNSYIDLKTGVCLDSKFQPYNESLLEYIWWNDGTKNSWLTKHGDIDLQERINIRINNAQTFCKKLKNRTIRNLQSNTIYVHLLHPIGFYMFGHLFDTLHKLESFVKHNTHKNVCFLVSDTALITEFETYLKILAPNVSFTILETKRTNSNEDLLYKCEKLIILAPTARPTKFKSRESCKYVCDSFSSYYKEHVPIETKSSKIFITRNPPNTRIVQNFNKIKEILDKKDISVIYGNESLADMFWYFSNASHICGYHGSALANIIFCNPNARALEFCAENRKDFSFVKKTRQFENYSIKFIKSDEKFNANLDIDEIVEFYSYDKSTDIKVAFFGSTSIRYTKLIENLEDLDAKYCITRSFNDGHFINNSNNCVDSVIEKFPIYCIIDWFRTVYHTPNNRILSTLENLKRKFDSIQCNIIFLLLPESIESRQLRHQAINCLIGFCAKASITIIDCNEYIKTKNDKEFILTEEQSKVIASALHKSIQT
jgi:hypothetical protein